MVIFFTRIYFFLIGACSPIEIICLIGTCDNNVVASPHPNLSSNMTCNNITHIVVLTLVRSQTYHATDLKIVRVSGSYFAEQIQQLFTIKFTIYVFMCN